VGGELPDRELGPSRPPSGQASGLSRPRLGKSWRQTPQNCATLRTQGARRRNYVCLADCLVRSRRLELPRAFAHNDLNVARLPVPPRPHHRKRSRNTAPPGGRCAPLAKGSHACKRHGRIGAATRSYRPQSCEYPARLPGSTIAPNRVPLWNEVSETLFNRVNTGVILCHEPCRHVAPCCCCRSPNPAAGAKNEPDRGAQVDTARVSVMILRPAVLKGGSLILNPGNATPRQRQSREGRVTYEFE